MKQHRSNIMKMAAVAVVLGLGVGAGVNALVKNAEQRGCQKGIVNILMEINPAVTIQLQMSGTLMPEVEKECQAALK
jgi:hypothetical protein